MLKRQRPSSPMPMSDAPEPVVDIDILERFTKRRRHFAPPRYHSFRKNPSISDNSNDEEDDGNDDDENLGYTRGRTQWQENAGLYKTANTLLHDLHAEQRHRMIFSSSFPSYNAQGAPVPSYSNSSQSSSHSQKHAVASHAGQSAVAPVPQHDQCSKAIPRGASMDDVEIQNVTQRYEDTNRLLGSLFLSRRRRLETQQQSSS